MLTQRDRDDQRVRPVGREKREDKILMTSATSGSISGAIVATELSHASLYGVSRTAGLLLIPYIAFVTIATLLNYYVWLLNQ